MEHYRVMIEGVEYIVEASSVAEAEIKSKEIKGKKEKTKNTIK
jgi:hypothetical protein